MAIQKSLLVIGGLSPAMRIFLEKASRSDRVIKVFDTSTKDTPGFFKYIKADITVGDIWNYKELRDCMAGCEEVVRFSDLSAHIMDNYAEFPFGKEVQGTLNAFEAARKTGITSFVQLLPKPLRRKLRGHLYDLTCKLVGEISRDFAETCDMNISFLSTGILFDGHRGYDVEGNKINGRGIKGMDLLGLGDLSRVIERLLELEFTGYHEYYLAGSMNALQKYEVRKSISELKLEFGDKYIFDG